MSTTQPDASTEAEKIRAQLNHPVIDGDGHAIEMGPILLDFVEAVAGRSMVERYTAIMTGQEGFLAWHHATPEQRASRRLSRPPWWFAPARNTLDRATAMLPALMRHRMDQFGIDFMLIYATEGLSIHNLYDSEVRCAVMRAINVMNAELFGPYRDRLVPTALIPMHTPQEAITELDYAVEKLGYKAIMIAGVLRRTIPEFMSSGRSTAEAMGASVGRPYWIDALGLDSPYDYDLFWQRCIDHKVAVTHHLGGQGWVNRNSISNFMYNHIGNNADGGTAFCKALFLGGVTRRFPQLKFAFLEGGVHWACSLYNDLIGHWHKRNVKALKENLDPAQVDRKLLAELIGRYGDKRIQAKRSDLLAVEGQFGAPFTLQYSGNPGELDEWKACGIESAEDIYRLFVPNFYFGCEADDRLNCWAFNKNVNPFGARLKAMFGSDIGHWDVTDASRELAEAYELVGEGLMTADDFRDFAFANCAELHASLNPDFFKGTVVEDAVQQLLDDKRDSANTGM